MTHIPEAAIDVAGRPHMRDAKGNLVPLENISAVDLLMDEMVRRQVAYAKGLSAEMARFLVYSEAEVAEFDALLAQNYGITRPEKAKGNRTFTTFDGLQQVKVKVQDRETFGPELQVAKRILDEIIRDRAEGADSLLVALVNQAFKVDKEGMVDRASLNAIRRLDIDDARWPDLCRAIDESRRTIGAKRYVTFHERQDSDERWQMVPLDHAAIEPGPEVFQEPSPRQQLAKARDLIGPLLRALGDENTDDLEAVVFAEQLADALGIDPECAIKAAEAA